MEAVAAGDEVALELVRPALVLERDPGPVGLEAVHGDLARLEEQRLAGVAADPDQILHDLGLAVDRDRPPAGQLGERDAVAAALEAQLEALVDEPLAVQALADAGLGQDVDRALLEDAGTDALLDVGAAAGLEHDGLNALAREQVAEEQAGRPGADDADLGAHQPWASASITRCAMANAEFAAGTPQ